MMPFYPLSDFKAFSRLKASTFSYVRIRIFPPPPPYPIDLPEQTFFLCGGFTLPYGPFYIFLSAKNFERGDWFPSSTITSDLYPLGEASIFSFYRAPLHQFAHNLSPFICEGWINPFSRSDWRFLLFFLGFPFLTSLVTSVITYLLGLLRVGVIKRLSPD